MFFSVALYVGLVPIVYKLVAVGEIKAESIVKEDQSSADTLAGFSLQKSWPVGYDWTRKKEAKTPR